MSTRLPAEWEDQFAILLVWPHPGTDWFHMLADVEATYLDIVRQVCRFQTVVILFHDQNLLDSVSEKFHALSIVRERIILQVVPNNDTWVRDSGPISVMKDNRCVALDFTFNAWGGKFKSDLDNQINSHLLESPHFSHIERQSVACVLEGGSIESDGSGTLLTTAQCLLNPNRNPKLSKSALENILAEQLGFSRFLWLNHGDIEGDDTDAHVDTLARFCTQDVIAHMVCDDSLDKHYAPLNAMQDELKSFRNAANHAYELIPLPLPKPIGSRVDGHRLPATYANFLIVNNAVLVPVYKDDMDEMVLRRLESVFNGREIIPIDCRSLIEHHGSLHCITMQLPIAYRKSA